MTRHDLKKLASKLEDRTVVASISGGKDSAAMSLYLTELDIEHRRVFADTGWEHPATYEYLRGALTAKLGPIDEVRAPEGGMVELVRKHGMFPSRLRRFCTRELKVYPLSSYIAALGCSTVNAVGIRADESSKRATQPEWEPADDIYGSDCLVWRPLIRWSEQDVIDIHHRHGLAPNPLYLRVNARRVGCWPCIGSRKDEIRAVAETTPERINLIRQLETEVTAARGKLRTFFDASRGAVDPTATPAQPIPIDRIVNWARTGRGGKVLEDFEKFAHRMEGGCVRWGLCETPSATARATADLRRAATDLPVGSGEGAPLLGGAGHPASELPASIGVSVRRAAAGLGHDETSEESVDQPTTPVEDVWDPDADPDPEPFGGVEL